jgi:hypothetical protein
MGAAAVEALAILIMFALALTNSRYSPHGETAMAQGIAFLATIAPALLVGFVSAAFATGWRARLFALHGILMMGAFAALAAAG